MNTSQSDFEDLVYGKIMHDIDIRDSLINNHIKVSDMLKTVIWSRLSQNLGDRWDIAAYIIKEQVKS